MDKTNTTRNTEDKSSKDGEFDFYLKSGLPATQVAATLKAQGKDQKDIDAFMEKYEASRKKIRKLVKKFLEKIEMKYGQLDKPELMKKGYKHATKHGFTQAERDAFVNYVTRGDTETPYLPFEELGYTKMSKFLGFSNIVGQQLSVTAQDQPSLNEIARLYETSKMIHSGIRHNLVSYTTCDPNAITGIYDKDKDNLNLFIHPLLIALFLSRIKSIEKRMLYSNLGRMVVQRSQAHFQPENGKYGPRFMLSPNDLLPEELQADLEFSYDIAKDPNSLDHFNDESPMSNLLKRFSVQIELWKNVLSLRQGKFYSRNVAFVDDNGIMGLHKVLSSYSATYFDSPDMYHVQDEGSLLRKLLAVFSFRPTFTQISSYLPSRNTTGYSNLGTVSKATFVNTPICSIKLPINLQGGPSQTIDINAAMSQAGWFIENKALVPKQTSIIYSRSVIFFYVNRRYQSPMANVNLGFNYLSLPGSLSGLTSINTTELSFNYDLTIGNNRFTLASVVMLNPLLNGQLATGCSSVVICPENPARDRPYKSYYYYNPLSASVMYKDPLKSSYVRNDPISPMPEVSNDPQIPEFVDNARKYGTIFMFVDPDEIIM